MNLIGMKSVRRDRPHVIAHRGAANRYPENTIAAFEAAIQMGADGIECDVRLSADGEPVVIHDATLERTTSGSGKVSGMTLNQLKRLDAGAGERIPTLKEIIALCRGRVLLCIELKAVDSILPTLNLLNDMAPESAVLCSFLPRALKICALTRPDIPTLLITGSRNPNPIVRWRETYPLPTIRRIRAGGISCHHRMLNKKLVKKVREAELSLVVWSALAEERDPPTWYESALTSQPDALVTTWPDKLLSLIKS